MFMHVDGEECVQLIKCFPTRHTNVLDYILGDVITTVWDLAALIIHLMFVGLL